ncbi:MAG: pyridoxal phosphate-dependent aminotransferase [Deltaproteobacteria bacterium]|nr:pyridoxal phosphate-dependent aminotransferase [Deltaproteobacteria bacterium]
MAGFHPFLAKRLRPKGGIDHRRVMIEKARAISDVISLGRGDPDLKTPAHIIEAAKRALDEGYTGYSPWPGYPELREAIARKLREENGIDATAQEVLVTVGAEEAVFLTMMALLDPGDEILVPEPRYTPYDMAVEIAGGAVVSVPTTLEDGFQIDPRGVEERITPRSKALLLITPNNPTGQILDRDRVAALAELAVRHDLVIISDELYEKIVFDGAINFSIGAIPGIKERTITINGFSKTYCMTGWRVGYLHAPAQIVDAMIPLKYTLTINCPSMCQRAALAALEGPQECVEEFRRIYDQRRRLVTAVLAKMGLKHGPARGAFYVFAHVAPMGMTSFDFCQRLLEEEKVLVFPGTAFGSQGEGFIRISLLAPLDKIEEAMARMERFVNSRLG